jgi:copper transport protein
VYLGNRTGQIGITLAASAGQAVIHLFAPGTDEPDEVSSVRFQLAAALDPPTGPTRKLAPRRCGPGCFVAATTWGTGTNQLTLRTSARGWAGGTITLAVPWPPHPDPAALTRLARTLRRSGPMTDYERVTSDTTTGPGSLDRIPITGPRFLAVEPYSNARATAVNTVAHPDGTSTIQIAYPDQNIYAELDLDRSGRPVRETLTDPDHLITRSFVYPEPG